MKKTPSAKRDDLLAARTEWSMGSSGHVGTMQLEVAGLELALELYRYDGQLFCLWRDSGTGSVSYRSPGPAALS